MVYSFSYIELFFRGIHGHDSESSLGIDGHFMNVMTLPPISRKGDITFYRDVAFHYKMMDILIKKNTHFFIRNYADISNSSLIKTPQIVECIEMPGKERVCIVKTFWIRCIQRKWKKICSYNKIKLKEMKKVSSILHSQLDYSPVQHIGLHGMWYHII